MPPIWLLGPPLDSGSKVTSSPPPPLVQVTLCHGQPAGAMELPFAAPAEALACPFGQRVAIGAAALAPPAFLLPDPLHQAGPGFSPMDLCTTPLPAAREAAVKPSLVAAAVRVPENIATAAPAAAAPKLPAGGGHLGTSGGGGGKAVAPPQPSPLSMEWSPFPFKGGAGGSGGFFGSGFTDDSHTMQVPVAFCAPAPSARCDPGPALMPAILVPCGPSSTLMPTLLVPPSGKSSTLMPTLLVPPSGPATSSQPGSAWGHAAALSAGLVTVPQQKPHHQPIEQAFSGTFPPAAPSSAPVAAG